MVQNNKNDCGKTPNTHSAILRKENNEREKSVVPENIHHPTRIPLDVALRTPYPPEILVLIRLLYILNFTHKTPGEYLQYFVHNIHETFDI